jgi:hypothetical protein
MRSSGVRKPWTKFLPMTNSNELELWTVRCCETTHISISFSPSEWLVTNVTQSISEFRSK